jgi:hypothetical protein
MVNKSPLIPIVTIITANAGIKRRLRSSNRLILRSGTPMRAMPVAWIAIVRAISKSPRVQLSIKLALKLHFRVRLVNVSTSDAKRVVQRNLGYLIAKRPPRAVTVNAVDRALDDISRDIRSSQVRPSAAGTTHPPGRKLLAPTSASIRRNSAAIRDAVNSSHLAEKVSTASARWVAYISRWTVSAAAIRGIRARGLVIMPLQAACDSVPKRRI